MTPRGGSSSQAWGGDGERERELVCEHFNANKGGCETQRARGTVTDFVAVVDVSKSMHVPLCPGLQEIRRCVRVPIKVVVEHAGRAFHERGFWSPV